MFPTHLSNFSKQIWSGQEEEMTDLSCEGIRYKETSHMGDYRKFVTRAWSEGEVIRLEVRGYEDSKNGAFGLSLLCLP